MRATRWLPLAALLAVTGFAPQAHAIVHLELEGGGGLNLRGPQEPIATASVRLNVLSLLDVGLRGEYVFGGSPRSCVPPGSGQVCTADLTAGGESYRAWMLFPELRLSTPTPFVKFDLALGGGLGNLKGINLKTNYYFDATDGAKPFGQVGIGMKIGIPTTDIYIRAEGSAAIFTGVKGGDIGNGVDSGILPIYQALIMLGYEGIGL